MNILFKKSVWKHKPKLYDNLLIHCACAKGSAELVRKLANPTNVTIRFPDNYEFYNIMTARQGMNMVPLVTCHYMTLAKEQMWKFLVEEFQITCECKDSNNYRDSNDYRYSGDIDDDGDSGEGGEDGDSADSGDMMMMVRVVRVGGW